MQIQLIDRAHLMVVHPFLIVLRRIKKIRGAWDGRYSGLHEVMGAGVVEGVGVLLARGNAELQQGDLGH